MSDSDLMKLKLKGAPDENKNERTEVVSFRISKKAKEDIDYIVKILGLTRGEWLEGVLSRDRKALGHVEQMVIDLNALTEVIGILKTYAYFAPTLQERAKITLSLQRLENDLKKALAEAPSFL